MVSRLGGWRVHVPAGLQEWVDNRLISAHIRVVRPMIMGLLFNLCIVFAALFGRVSGFWLSMFAGAIAIGCLHRHYLALGIERSRQRSHAIQLDWWFTSNSAHHGVWIGLMLAFSMPHVSGAVQMLLAVSAVSQVAATAFTTRTMPKAAFAFMAPAMLGLIAGLLRIGSAEALGTAILAAAGALVMSTMVIIAHKSFVERILHERELNESMTTVRLLLNDYEDHGSDWLFSLDRDGCMTGVNMRFAEAAGKDVGEMNGAAFASLFDPSPETKRLADHLSTGRAFRNLVVRLSGSKQDRIWWSVSGRPVGGADSSVRFRGVISDISAEKRANARVRHMAHYDSLTELPNRLMFNNALNRAFAEQIEGRPIALLCLDVDQFKSVNDMYGHPAGDAFLRLVAERLACAMTSSHLGSEFSLLARLGGDEFAILLVGADAGDKAVRLAGHLVEAMAVPYLVDGHEVHSSVSIGIALSPLHASTAHVLQSHADIALYVAKDEGRNRWEMFAAGMDTAIQQRHAIERDLRHALVNDELRLFLQPLIDVETGQHVGFEALVRWEHPEKGMIMPLDFIPVAEATGLIVPMGEWVLRTAMREAASWIEPRTIAVNLSPVQLSSPNLLPIIINGLAESGLDPARLELEITENVLMHNCEANIAILNRLHSLGVKIALDDFGTGYASLNYLRTFPFDKIKIDRSFVTDLETHEDCRAIIGAVIGLANELGMCTLAEGVEHESQLTKLREQGCSMVQGWLFGKAMPAEHYAELKQVAGDTRKVA